MATDRHGEQPHGERPHGESMERQFGRVAALYATSEHAGGRDLERLVELVRPTPGDRVLDIATGAGHVAAALAPLVRSVVATDIAPGMAAQARRTLEALGSVGADWRVQLADAERLPFPPASFDVVTCRIAPHHFADVGQWLRETARVLTPGGRLVVVDSLAPDDPEPAAFLHDVEVLRDPTHVRAYRRGEWEAMVESAGFVVERVEVERKRRDFERWLERGGGDTTTAAEVRARFLGASDDVRAAFDVEIVDGAVVAFADDKLVLAARLAG